MRYPYPSHRIHEIVRAPKCVREGETFELKSKGERGTGFDVNLDLVDDGPFSDPRYLGNTSILHPDSVRQTLQSFWGESLEIATTRSGLSLAVPLCFPDGWQVVFDLQSLTPKAVRVTDRGRTLQWLTSF